MFRWYRRWQERKLDRLAVKVVDRIETLYEVHRPAEHSTDIKDLILERINKRSTFTVADLAHVKMRNPGRHNPRKRKRK